VLTGEGADEVLGGYDIFKEAKVREFIEECRDSSWRPAAATPVSSSGF
jgi:asparagine synthase (glutamine-hydrolysing)